jgi:hypothetical protein
VLWVLVAMLVILAIAVTIVLVVAYPHRDELPSRPAPRAALKRLRAAAVPGGTRGRLWLDGRRG